MNFNQKISIIPARLRQTSLKLIQNYEGSRGEKILQKMGDHSEEVVHDGNVQALAERLESATTIGEGTKE